MNTPRNNFHLRVLTTNGCDQECSYCMNDFQLKPGKEDPQFLDLNIASRAITAYMELMNAHHQRGIITFSGGEPGLWYFLPHAIHRAELLGAIVKICTNGAAFYRKGMKNLKRLVHMWHVHVNEPTKIPDWVPMKAVQIRYVVTKDTTIRQMIEIIESYSSPIKFFVDFFDKDKNSLYEKIRIVAESNPDKRTVSLHTGKQVNRRGACAICVRPCVTLKGVWVFPDGMVSTCPQDVVPRKKIPADEKAWSDYMAEAYELHSREESN